MVNPINYYYTTIMNGLLTESETAPPQGQGVSFAGIGAMGDFWDVLEGPLMDSIYWETWYNGDNVSVDELGSIYYENKVLGVPRLRQVRVKRNSCKVNSKFKDTISYCYDSYSWFSESQEPFGIYATDQSNMNDTAYVMFYVELGKVFFILYFFILILGFFFNLHHNLKVLVMMVLLVHMVVVVM